MKKHTCSEYIALILKRGGRWRNRQIECAIIETYGIQFQNNTIAKYLSLMMHKGQVLSAPVKMENGEICSEYRWVAKGKKKKGVLMTIDKLLAECLSVAGTYPVDHPQLKKIKKQCIELEKRKSKEATYI